MPAHAILGAQWGDEGKGKLVDVLAPGYDYVARFQGGNNAGHTVIVGRETFKFNLLPSGAVQGRRVVIGNGVVVDPRVLVKEIEQLAARGRSVRLLVSERAHVIMPYHVQLDGIREEGGGSGRKLGTTKRGIGPCYADKAARLGIRFFEFCDEERFRRRLEEVYPAKERELRSWGLSPAPVESLIAEYAPLAAHLREYVADAGRLLDESLESGKRVLFEGAQGILLDVDHGTYPFVTSSSTVGVASGAGVAAHHLKAVLGVAKAYATRVGEGPFPTELPTKEGPGKRMLEVGKEFGTVTGRARRVGWLDLVALRYAVRVGGLTHVALTKLDVLEGLDEVHVCVRYEDEGRKVSHFPTADDEVARMRPVYRRFSGWSSTASRRGRTTTLAPEAAAFVRFVEKHVERPVVMASVGPDRDATLTLRRHPFGSPPPSRSSSR